MENEDVKIEEVKNDDVEIREVENKGRGKKHKKIWVICIVSICFLALLFGAIQVISRASYYTKASGNVREFVDNWNERSKESDFLTKGIKISASEGDHEYDLGNGVILKYSVNTYWWVKYFSTAVILEFSEEEQELVYDISEKLLELFDGIENKESMFASAMEKVEVDRPTIISKFSVLKYSGEYSANFIEEKILQSNSVTGYAWNLTMEKWCENFNSYLKYAIDDAAQASYNWICEAEKEIELYSGVEFDADATVKDELIEKYIQEYLPISMSDFRKMEVWTDGTHEYAIYVYRYPSWDSVLGQISLFVDENGYIFDIESLIPHKLNDTVKELASGDRRILFMEFYGYPALACAGTGEYYSNSLDGVDRFYTESDITTINLTETVSMGAIVTKDGLCFIYLPNKEENFEKWLSTLERWTLKPTE